MNKKPEIWAVADERRGVENQAIGLAQRLADLTNGHAHRAVIRKDGYITLPDAENPDVWIGCGRPAITVARQHRKSYPSCRFIYLQDPRGSYDLFDLIVAPEHDQLTRTNAVSMLGSTNRLSDETLRLAQTEFAERLNQMPARKAALLIGGPNKRLRISPEVSNNIIQRCHLLRSLGYGLLITTSRRTPKALADQLTKSFSNQADVWLHTGKGANPYFAYLAAADVILVTEESTNMLTEAAYTGKPLYAIPLEGNPGKFRRLHAGLEAHGALRPFLGDVEHWQYSRLDETGRIASLIAERFLGRDGAAV